jgi:hypothetical protein
MGRSPLSIGPLIFCAVAALYRAVWLSLQESLSAVDSQRTSAVETCCNASRRSTARLRLHRTIRRDRRNNQVCREPSVPVSSLSS